jgi:GntR family transcriptional regulator
MASRPSALAQEQPRYVRIAEALAAQIESGELSQGTKLLGERELSKHFDASRVTLRRALVDLRDRGLIEADSSRGWFVASPYVGEPNALMGFSEMAKSRGLTASSIVLRAEVRAATIDEADELRIGPGSETFDLERVRCLDGVPVAIEHSRIPLRYAPSLPRADFASASLYDELRTAGAIPSYANYTLQAVGAATDQARRLDVVEGTPLLMANAITHDRGGRPIELSRSVFRGDRYRFRTTLFRSRREGAPER